MTAQCTYISSLCVGNKQIKVWPAAELCVLVVPVAAPVYQRESFECRIHAVSAGQNKWRSLILLNPNLTTLWPLTTGRSIWHPRRSALQIKPINQRRNEEKLINEVTDRWSNHEWMDRQTDWWSEGWPNTCSCSSWFNTSVFKVGGWNIRVFLRELRVRSTPLNTSNRPSSRDWWSCTQTDQLNICVIELNSIDWMCTLILKREYTYTYLFKIL